MAKITTNFKLPCKTKIAKCKHYKHYSSLKNIANIAVRCNKMQYFTNIVVH